jgi:hypothetical protein
VGLTLAVGKSVDSQPAAAGQSKVKKPNEKPEQPLSQSKTYRNVFEILRAAQRVESQKSKVKSKPT